MISKNQPKKQTTITGDEIEVPEPKKQTSIVAEYLREQIEPDRRKQSSIVPDFDD